MDKNYKYTNMEAANCIHMLKLEKAKRENLNSTFGAKCQSKISKPNVMAGAIYVVNIDSHGWVKSKFTDKYDTVTFILNGHHLLKMVVEKKVDFQEKS